jgi:magnesium-dependent phosphatase-1
LKNKIINLFIIHLIPKMNPATFVFDLDYTIWPFDCDKDVIAPFTMCDDGNIRDRYGRIANPYPDVPGIIAHIIDKGIPIIFASRNRSRGSIEALLKTIPIVCHNENIKTIWDALMLPNLLHAYSSDGIGKGKDKHFAAIYNDTLINFTRMIFYDDIPENIEAARAQGTTSILLSRRYGLTWQKFSEGIVEWRSRKMHALTLDDLAIASMGLENIPV